MKKLIFIGAFLFIAFTAQAQEQSAVKKDAIELVKSAGVTAAFESALSQFSSLIPADKKEAFEKEAKGTLPGLYDKLSDLYVKEFSHDEIKAITAFYKTAAGKKMADKSLIMTQQAMAVGQNWGMELQSLAQKFSK